MWLIVLTVLVLALIVFVNIKKHRETYAPYELSRNVAEEERRLMEAGIPQHVRSQLIGGGGSEMHDAIAELRDRTRQKDMDWDERHRELERESSVLRIRKSSDLLPCLRKARPRDYKEWLEGFLAKGGKPTHWYDYPITNRGVYLSGGQAPATWFVAKKDFATLPLCGSMAIHVIVPTGIQVDKTAGLGHCNLYYMDGFGYDGHWVPVFTDTVVN